MCRSRESEISAVLSLPHMHAKSSAVSGSLLLRGGVGE